MNYKSILPVLIGLFLALPAALSAHYHEATRATEQVRARSSQRRAEGVYHHAAGLVDEVPITCRTSTGDEVTIFVAPELAKLLVVRDCCWYSEA